MPQLREDYLPRSVKGGGREGGRRDWPVYMQVQKMEIAIHHHLLYHDRPTTAGGGLAQEELIIAATIRRRRMEWMIKFVVVRPDSMV